MAAASLPSDSPSLFQRTLHSCVLHRGVHLLISHVKYYIVKPDHWASAIAAPTDRHTACKCNTTLPITNNWVIHHHPEELTNPFPFVQPIYNGVEPTNARSQRARAARL